MKERSLAIGSTLAALLASLCCLGPLLLGGAGLVAVLVATFAPLRPYFLAVSGVLLAGGFYLVYRKPKAAEGCAGETCAPQSRNRHMAKPLLWVAALAVAALAFFPCYGVRLVGKPAAPASISPATLQSAELKIMGMDCAVCSGVIQRKLLETPGVV
jgi:mercuric ion transport protein